MQDPQHLSTSPPHQTLKEDRVQFTIMKNP